MASFSLIYSLKTQFALGFHLDVLRKEEEVCSLIFTVIPQGLVHGTPREKSGPKRRDRQLLLLGH